MSKNVTPLDNRVLVKQDEEPEMTSGGLYLPDTAKESPQQGVVRRVGPGKRLDSGELLPLSVKEGDKVIFGKYSGTKMKVDGEELLFMREDDIMAIVE